MPSSLENAYTRLNMELIKLSDRVLGYISPHLGCDQGDGLGMVKFKSSCKPLLCQKASLMNQKSLQFPWTELHGAKFC